MKFVYNGRDYVNYQHFRDSRVADDARRAAFEASAVGKALRTPEGRASLQEAAMLQEPVYRVEIAEPVGKYKGDLTEARVNARIDGEMNAVMNKQGGAEFAVPTSNIYGTPQITPIFHPFAPKA